MRPVTCSLSRPQPGQATGSGAFTLPELLAVLGAIVLIWIALAVGHMATRPDFLAAQCRNNLEQLSQAWSMYSADNHGALVYNGTGATGLAHGSEAWVAGWLDFTASSDNTNTAMLIDHRAYPFAAYLGPYVHSAKVFKCPADNSAVRIGGRTFPRVRSVSMNNYLGGNSMTWGATSVYLLYTNRVQIKSPARLFVVIDEREESISDGLFLSDANTRWQLIKIPANRHHGGAGISFADGHAEIHHWKDPRTSPVLQPGQTLPLNQNLPGDVDVTWLQQSAAGLPGF